MIGAFFTYLLDLSLEIAPLLLLGLGVAGLLHLFVSEQQVLRHLGRRGWSSILKGTLFAIPLPLCSCSVVPVVASLRRKGASTGASVSFLVAAPQIGADSWLLTYGLLGPVFAGSRILASFVTALVAGGLLKNVKEERSLDGNAVASISSSKGWLRSFWGHVWELFGGLASNLVTGLVLAALILLAVPEDLLREFSSESPLISMLVMLVVGIPMYVCATASTPIAAALVMKGLNPGAALVFLLTGPATNLVTMALLKSSLGWRALMVYVASIAGTSMAAGWLLSSFMLKLPQALTDHIHQHESGVAWWKWLSLAVLTLMLLVWFVQRYRPVKRSGEPASDAIRFKVGGMTCSHCVARVRQALESETDVTSVDIDLGNGEAHVVLRGGKPGREQIDAMRQKVIQAGYDAELGQAQP